MPSPRWQPGESGNPAGRLRGSRNRLSEVVICALLRDFEKHGEKAIARVREENPAMYLKVFAMVLPRQHKVEHTNPTESLSDEQLTLMIAELEERIARRTAGGDAKLIEGTVEATAGEATAGEATRPPVLEPPKRRPNRLMMEADTAIGPRERKPRKRMAKPPGKGEAE
jgi:Family of unknown function (DUF5681)